MASSFQLPDYSSESVLRERLLAATAEKGFHLNWEFDSTKKLSVFHCKKTFSTDGECCLFNKSSFAGIFHLGKFSRNENSWEWFHGSEVGRTFFCFLETAFLCPFLQNVDVLWLMKVCDPNSIENTYLLFLWKSTLDILLLSWYNSPARFTLQQ